MLTRHLSRDMEISSALLLSAAPCLGSCSVKVDGGDLRGITAVGDLVSLAVESEAGASISNGLFTVAEHGHVAEYLSQILTLPVQAHLAVHIQIQCVLGGVDSPAQFLRSSSRDMREGGYLVGVAKHTRWGATSSTTAS